MTTPGVWEEEEPGAAAEDGWGAVGGALLDGVENMIKKVDDLFRVRS
jgi:hypothetical protein